MTALADALVAAQSRAVAALGKQYVGGTIGSDETRAAFTAMGLTDETDTVHLLAAWDVLRDTGAQAPGEQAQAERPSDKMTAAQKTLIDKLVAEKNVPAPDLEQRTKQEAHEIIDSLKAGTYDPAKWSIPF